MHHLCYQLSNSFQSTTSLFSGGKPLRNCKLYSTMKIYAHTDRVSKFKIKAKPQDSPKQDELLWGLFCKYQKPWPV